MKRFLCWWGSILLLSVCICTTALAEFTPPAQPLNYISDYANLISPADQKQLNTDLRKYYDQSGNQIMIAIFKTLDNDEIQNASMKLAEQWKVGKKGVDSGVLISVFNKEHQIRIEVGYGLEDRLTDAKSAELIQTILIPEFRSGNYAQGLNKTITQIKAILGDVYGASTAKAEIETDPLNGVIVIIAEIAIVIYLFLSLFFTSPNYMKLGTGMLLGALPLQMFTTFSVYLLGLGGLLLLVLMAQSWFLVGNLSLFFSTIANLIQFILTSSGRGGGSNGSGGGGSNSSSGGGGRFGGGGASGKW